MPARANVSFVEARGPDALFVRTFERGVGLTDSCGSAMAASVLAAALTGRVAYGAQVQVFNRGGLVRGIAGDDRVVTIEGNATFEWDGEVVVDLAMEQASNLRVIRERRHEQDAWAGLAASEA